jgi:hypothetical protein
VKLPQEKHHQEETEMQKSAACGSAPNRDPQSNHDKALISFVGFRPR